MNNLGKIVDISSIDLLFNHVSEDPDISALQKKSTNCASILKTISKRFRILNNQCEKRKINTITRKTNTEKFPTIC